MQTKLFSHTSRKNSSRCTIWATVAIVSLLINLIVVLPYIKPCHDIIVQKMALKSRFNEKTPDKELLNTVCRATLDHSGVKMSMNEPKGLPLDLINFFKPKRNSDTRNNYYTAYGYAGLSYYGIQTKNRTLMESLKQKASSMYDAKKGVLTYDIIKIDQVPIGIFFLNMYRWYNKEEYRTVARNIFKHVMERRNANGIVMYRPDTKVQLSDAVGMYVPFLMEYFNVTGDSLAYKVAYHNMKEYYTYGVDHRTGIPAHGYDLKSGILTGSANWGRGIGWYLLAAAYCPQINDPALNKTLSCLEYTQFPGSSEKFDSSTALMFEIYKQSKNPHRKLSLNFIKPHVSTDGFVGDCSGDTYGLNSYSKMFGESELCNGLLLMLVSRFSNTTRPQTQTGH